MYNPVLNLQNVTKSIKHNMIFQNINLEMEKGSLLVISGKKGEGKTTLINCVLGFTDIDSGTVSLYGYKPRDLSPELKNRIAYLPQHISGFEWMKVHEYTQYLNCFYLDWDSQLLNDLFNVWDIDKQAQLAELTKEERKLLAIACTMAQNADFYVLDEPAYYIEPGKQNHVIKYMIELFENLGKTVLISTHLSGLLNYTDKEILVLRNQQLLYTGNLANLHKRIKKVHIQAITDFPEYIPLDNIISSKIDKTSATLVVDEMDEQKIKILEYQLSAIVTVEQLKTDEIIMELGK